LITATKEYGSLSAFALSIVRQRNPQRLACDGWKEIRLNGVKLEVLREEARIIRDGGGPLVGV
jgi:hypothetical protein